MRIIIEFESEDIPDKTYERNLLTMLNQGYKGRYRVINKIPTGAVSFNSIETAVCEHFKCSPEYIQLKTRKREVVEARQICFYLSRNAKLGTLSSIGFRFGRKDHATALHGFRNVALLLETDKPYQEKYKSFIESFEDGS